MFNKCLKEGKIIAKHVYYKKKKKTLLGYVPVIQNIAMLYYDKSVRCTSQVALKTYIVLIILTGIAMLPTVHMILD